VDYSQAREWRRSTSWDEASTRPSVVHTAEFVLTASASTGIRGQAPHLTGGQLPSTV